MKWFKRLLGSSAKAADTPEESAKAESVAAATAPGPESAAEPGSEQSSTKPATAPRSRGRGRRPATMGRTDAEQNYLAEAAKRARQS